jgi:amino acid transporter
MHSIGTPVYGIAMSAIVVVILSGYDFSDLVEMLNLLFCFGQAIEFFAFLHLRYHRMDIYRPYTIPLGFTGCCIMLIPPFLFMGIIIFFSSTSSLLLCIGMSLFGVVLYYVLEYSKTNNILEFQNIIGNDMQQYRAVLPIEFLDDQMR